MTKNGYTTFELIITIVIISIIATFTVSGVTVYVKNARNKAFIENTNTIMTAAKDSYLTDPDIWVDGQVTLRQLVENDLISLPSKDPYGGEYDYDQTIITSTRVNDVAGVNIVPIYTLDLNSTSFDTYSVLFGVTVVTTKATLGATEPLNFYTTGDIVFLETTETVFDRIAQSFSGNVTDSFQTTDDHDEITVEKSIRNHTTVTTNGGDDDVQINNNLEYYSNLDTGSGNDSINIDGYLRGNSTIDSGDGDDTITIDRNVQTGTIDTGSGNDTVVLEKNIYDSTVNTGDGDDSFSVTTLGKNTTVFLEGGNDSISISNKMYIAILNTGSGSDNISVTKDVFSNSTIITEDGDDTITIGGNINDSTVNAGTGNDKLTVKQIRNTADILMGAGDDIVTINDVVSNFDGTIDLGIGNDRLTVYEERLDRFSKGAFVGGAGYDTLELPDTTLKEWNDGASELFSGFEYIILEDTTIDL